MATTDGTAKRAWDGRPREPAQHGRQAPNREWRKHTMEQTISDLTVDHLGGHGIDGSEEILDQFKAACERVLPAFDDDEQAAIDWVWGDGDFSKRLDANLDDVR